MASEILKFVIGLIVLSVVGAIVYFAVKNGLFGQEQVQIRPETKTVSWMPSTQVAKNGNTKTYIGEPTPYWIIPKEKRPDGGWDSIGGFWDAESPTRWIEKWQYSFCHDQVK